MKGLLFFNIILLTIFTFNPVLASEIIICTHGERGNMPDRQNDFSPAAKIFCNDKNSDPFKTSLAELYKMGYGLITVVPIEYEVVGELKVRKSWQYYLDK